MASKILIATPQPEFGELIRLNIEEGGEYEATLVKTGREVMELSNSIKFDLVILDASLPDKPFVPMAQNLIDENPKMKIIVLPPNNDPKDASLEEILYHGILSRPFYPPDLVEMVNELLAPPLPAANIPAVQPPVESVINQVAQETIETTPTIPLQTEKLPLPMVAPPQIPEKEENFGPINEEDFAKEVEALFAQEANKNKPYDFIKEISASPTPPPPAVEPEPVLEEPIQGITEAEQGEITLDSVQPEVIPSEEETDAFAHQLAAQIYAETETKRDITGVEKEVEALLAAEADAEIQGEAPQVEEPIIEPEPQALAQSNADFARQILSQVIQDTTASVENSDDFSADLSSLFAEPIEPAPGEIEAQQPEAEIVSLEPAAAEPIRVAIDMPEPSQEMVAPSNEVTAPLSLQAPEEKKKPAPVIEEPAEDDEAIETYVELTQDDNVLSQKHASMAARYAELASEYHSLAREHADLAQRHAEIAAERVRLGKEKMEMASRKRELVSEIYQTQHSLKEMLSQTNARAALIIKSGDMVAQVGNLSRDALQEVASILVRYWDGDKKSDLIRFIRLQTDHSEQLLYAALIREDFILGLLYEPATSISLMRPQAARVTRKLAEEPLIDILKLPVEDLEKISQNQPIAEADMDAEEEQETVFDAFSDLPIASLDVSDELNGWVPETTETYESSMFEESNLPLESTPSEEPLKQSTDEHYPSPDDVFKDVLAQMRSQSADSSENLAEPFDTIYEPLFNPQGNPTEAGLNQVELQPTDGISTPDENPIDVNAILNEVNHQLDSQLLDSNDSLLAEAAALDSTAENEAPQATENPLDLSAILNDVFNQLDMQIPVTNENLPVENTESLAPLEEAVPNMDETPLDTNAIPNDVNAQLESQMTDSNENLRVESAESFAPPEEEVSYIDEMPLDVYAILNDVNAQLESQLADSNEILPIENTDSLTPAEEQGPSSVGTHFDDNTIVDDVKAQLESQLADSNENLPVENTESFALPEEVSYKDETPLDVNAILNDVYAQLEDQQADSNEILPVENVESFAPVEEHASTVDKPPVDINAILNDVINQFNNQSLDSNENLPQKTSESFVHTDEETPMEKETSLDAINIPSVVNSQMTEAIGISPIESTELLVQAEEALTPDETPVDINAIINDVIKELDNQIPDSNDIFPVDAPESFAPLEEAVPNMDETLLDTNAIPNDVNAQLENQLADSTENLPMETAESPAPLNEAAPALDGPQLAANAILNDINTQLQNQTENSNEILLVENEESFVLTEEETPTGNETLLDANTILNDVNTRLESQLADSNEKINVENAAMATPPEKQLSSVDENLLDLNAILSEVISQMNSQGKTANNQLPAAEDAVYPSVEEQIDHGVENALVPNAILTETSDQLESPIEAVNDQLMTDEAVSEPPLEETAYPVNVKPVDFNSIFSEVISQLNSKMNDSDDHLPAETSRLDEQTSPMNEAPVDVDSILSEINKQLDDQMISTNDDLLAEADLLDFSNEEQIPVTDENPIDVSAMFAGGKNHSDDSLIESKGALHTTHSALPASSEGKIGNQIPEWITNAPPTPEGEVPYIPTLDQETGESYEKPSLPDNIYYDYEEDNWHIIRSIDIDQPDSPASSQYRSLSEPIDIGSPVEAQDQAAPLPINSPETENDDAVPADQIYHDVLTRLQHQENSSDDAVVSNTLDQPVIGSIPGSGQEEIPSWASQVYDQWVPLADVTESALLDVSATEEAPNTKIDLLQNDALKAPAASFENVHFDQSFIQSSESVNVPPAESYVKEIKLDETEEAAPVLHKLLPQFENEDQSMATVSELAPGEVLPEAVPAGDLKTEKTAESGTDLTPPVEFVENVDTISAQGISKNVILLPPLDNSNVDTDIKSVMSNDDQLGVLVSMENTSAGLDDLPVDENLNDTTIPDLTDEAFSTSTKSIESIFATAAEQPIENNFKETATPLVPQSASDNVPKDLVFPWEEEPQPKMGITTPIKINPAPLTDPSRTQPVRIKQPAVIVSDVKTHETQPTEDVSYMRTISHLLSHQSFTCVLVPRLSETPITQELAHFIGEQMTQIASVFGWQLGSIHIQSNYMLWSIQVMPSVSVGNIIRIIRQRTSKRLLVQFPYLSNFNDTGDFWAPGFLSVNSAIPPSDPSIEEFIALSHRRQDLLKALEA